jgi:hypothetical protein
MLRVLKLRIPGLAYETGNQAIVKILPFVLTMRIGFDFQPQVKQFFVSPFLTLMVNIFPDEFRLCSFELHLVSLLKVFYLLPLIHIFERSRLIDNSLSLFLSHSLISRSLCVCL